MLETLLTYVAAPAAIYGLIALLTLRSQGSAARRYRPGAGWDYPAIWWTANPAALPSWQKEEDADTGVSSATGGARGRW